VGMLGFFIAPCLTMGIELACEIGYPVGEAYSNGMIQIFGNINGIILMITSSLILDKQKMQSYEILIIIGSIIGLGLILIVLMKEILKR